MATSAAQTLLSPAELAYLHASLSLTPPIRPDGRSPTHFRPLEAQTNVSPGTNGSARVCFSDGTEAIIGVKAQLEKTADPYGTLAAHESRLAGGDGGAGDDAAGDALKGRNEWLDLSIEIPGTRDDEGSTVFLANMLSEAVLADGEFAKKLYINRRFHWKLCLDILLISEPLSYPLPLLSLTTHLALLSTRVPRLKSEGDEDPMFDDDWEAARYLYPREARDAGARPPVTMLVMSVGGNVIFDPTREELAVAESALAVSVAEVPRTKQTESDMEVDGEGRELRLLAVRTVDPPSRLTAAGLANADNPATAIANGGKVAQAGTHVAGEKGVQGVWRPPLGGTKYAVLEAMIGKVMERGGIADEVLDALDGVELE